MLLTGTTLMFYTHNNLVGIRDQHAALKKGQPIAIKSARTPLRALHDPE